MSYKKKVYIKFQTKRGTALSDLYVREALKKGAHYFFLLKEKGGTCDTLFSSLILTYLVPRYLKHLMHITDVLQISRALFRHPTRPLLLPGKNISAPIRRWGKIFSPLEEYTSLNMVVGVEMPPPHPPPPHHTKLFTNF